jgi:predicted DNA-binding transcriptional regulator AlpA
VSTIMNNTISTPALITRRQLAQRAQISERTLDKLRVKGLTPPFVRIGRQIRFPEGPANDWLINGTKVA